MTDTDFQSLFQLSDNDIPKLQKFLSDNGKLESDEKIKVLEIAGEGNMNVVVRVVTNERSFILKQSRPWVQKYPSVAAPIERINVEAQFYKLVLGSEVLQKYVPTINWFDEENLILCMDDLGLSADYTSIYRKGTNLSKPDVVEIATVMSALHSLPVEAEKIENSAMRKLNHQHIFLLPLQENNGFDLDTIQKGLQESTAKFRSDDRLKKCALELGGIYLAKKGDKLLHGDFYPGSWLNTKEGFKVIDPEFCFHGKPEFELGVTIAHLKLAQQPDSFTKDMFLYYQFDSHFDGALFSRFAGIEILRRLIGLAQLPLELELAERLDLLDEAYELVVNG